MTTEERRKRIDELFNQAVDLSVELRRQYLDTACVNDAPDIRQQVEKLLRAHDQAKAQTPFEKPLGIRGMQQLTNLKSRDPMIGQEVGSYVIRRRIGQGGFGTVYLADRTRVYKQKVAIKIIRPDRVAEETVIERFNQERQMLATLQHENISRLLDGGTSPEGWPFFVMEYIEGTPITTFCDRMRMSIEDRLKLFHRVCTAVTYAHDLDIVHRDIKPSNVLVTCEGAPKILDFGLAKVIDPRSRRQLVSLTEGGIIGTPVYASPEQISGDKNSQSFATDVYSLGVVLYELLTGHRPFELKNTAFHNTICNEPPRSPRKIVFQPLEESSESVTTTVTPDELSLRRNATPFQLARKIRGELETICLKCLEKEPTRRFGTACELAEDLRLFLEGRPIRSRPITGLRRTYRWCRRNSSSLALITATVVLFTLGLSYFIDRTQSRAELAANELISAAKAAQLSERVSQLTWNRRWAIPHLKQVLHNESDTDMSREEELMLHQQQANAAAALFAFQYYEDIRPFLSLSSDPTARSYLIDRLSAVTSVRAIVSSYSHEKDDSIRRALILSMGNLPVPNDNQPVNLLFELFEKEPDPGLHSSVEWVLMRWGQGKMVAKVRDSLKVTPKQMSENPHLDERRWYVNSQGQTFAVLHGGEFVMGSPYDEPGHEPSERYKPRQMLPYGFAICTTEVTVAQFRLFKETHSYMRDYSPEDDCPINSVSWYKAAEYCNWLSEVEGIRRDQMCYAPNKDRAYGPGMKTKIDYLHLEGYRLPTETEWEFACRANTSSMYSFGNSMDLLENYGHYSENTDSRSCAVGTLMPNDFGLFDTHGNVKEWCQSRFRTDDYAHGTVGGDASDRRVLRGGSWGNGVFYARSAKREDSGPGHSNSNVIGFRVARTYR